MKKYIRSSSTIVFTIGNKKIIGYGSMQSIFNENDFKKIYMLLEFLEKEKNESEINDFLKDNDIDYEVFELCLDKKFITDNKYVLKNDEHSADFKNRLYLDCCYERSELILNKIRNSTIINVGCGGIGNYLLYAYSSFMPKQVIMIDGDIVSESNLNRQILFDLDDIGKKKTEILKLKLKKRFPSVKFESVPKFSTKEELSNVLNGIKDKSNCIIVISGDSSKTVMETTKVAAQYQIPCLNVGYLNDYSIIGPFFIPSISACPFCSDIGADYDDNSFNEFKNFNSFYRAPSSFINSSMASSMALIDIFNYFSEDYQNINSLNKRIGINNRTFEVMRIGVQKNESCRICKK